MKIILDRQHLEAVRLACDDKLRPQLCGIHVDATGAVTATCGHALIHISPALGRDGFPEPEGFQAPELGPEGVVIPTLVAEDALRQVPRGKGNPLMRGALLEIIKGNVALRTGGAVVSAQVIEQRFPNWRQVIPQGKPVFRVAFDPRPLTDALTALVAMGATGVKMYFTASEKPMRFEAKLPTGEDVTGLVMPHRFSE